MSSGTTYRHLANWITLSRILGVMLIFWFTPFQSLAAQLWTVLIYILVSSTDFLDGWVARRFNIVSDMGKVLDPLADKILVLVFLPLLEMQVISSFPVFIILAREFAIMALRVVSAKNGTIIAANLSGKIKTFVTLPVCGILLGLVPVAGNGDALPLVLQPLHVLQLWVQSWPSVVITTLVWSTVLVTIWSFLDYFGVFLWQYYVDKSGGDREKAKLLIRSLLPNAVTLLNLFFGLLAIYFSWIGDIKTAVFLILISVFLDALDGKLARLLQAETGLGARLDSKADFVSFGVAPAICLFSALVDNTSVYVAFTLGFLYYVSVHYRLWRFDKSGGHSAYFDGLPSPVGASVLGLFMVSPILSSFTILALFSVIISFLMVSRLRYLHNHASKETVLRFLHFPTLIFLILSLLTLFPHSFFGVFNWGNALIAPHVLLGLIGLYVLSPLFLRHTD